MMYTNLPNQHHANKLFMMRDSSLSNSSHIISDSGVESGSSPEMNSSSEEPPMSRTHQYRKVMKPLLERKRRARINKCLDNLKDIMVNTLQAEGESITKLEKADVLELTVKHLRKLKRQNALGLTPQATYAGRFRAGYSHCAREVSKFMSQGGGGAGTTVVESATSARLLSHLANCLHTLEAMPPSVVSMAVSPLGGPGGGMAVPNSPFANTSYHHHMMTSPFATSSSGSVPVPTSSPSDSHASLLYHHQQQISPTAPISSSFRGTMEKPLDLIKVEKENCQEAQDLSLSGAKQRIPLSTKSPSSYSNIKRSKSTSPPSAHVNLATSKDDSTSWRPW